jgi:cell division protein FtsZ
MAFRISDEILANATKGIIEMVTKPGMVNLDFADLRSVLKDSGYAVIGIGEANSTQTNDRASVAINNTLSSPLLDVDLSTAKKALVNIIGGEDLTLREAEKIFQEVAARISEDAMMKWGARIDPTMQKSAIKIMVVLGGVEFADYSDVGIKKKLEESKNVDLDKIFED